MLAFPKVSVGDSVDHESLTIFPLFADTTAQVEYLLSDEAITGGVVTVEEVTEGGSVPTLLVDNQSGSPVLFLEGEELRGAKQNRVLNASVLVAARSKTPIPVSCVEQGRWRYRSRHFGSSGSHCSPKMRHVLKGSVSRSAREGQGHTSDQGGVWREVSRQMACLGSQSATAAMADTYDDYRDRLAEYQARLPYVEGAAGLAVAVGGKVVSVDLFDKPATCRKVWGRLLTGVFMDAFETGAVEERAGRTDAETMLSALRDAPWQPVPAVGTGEELRAELPGDRHASALTFGEAIVHGSLIAVG